MLSRVCFYCFKLKSVMESSKISVSQAISKDMKIDTFHSEKISIIQCMYIDEHYSYIKAILIWTNPSNRFVRFSSNLETFATELRRINEGTVFPGDNFFIQKFLIFYHRIHVVEAPVFPFAELSTSDKLLSS